MRPIIEMMKPRLRMRKLPKFIHLVNGGNVLQLQVYVTPRCCSFYWFKLCLFVFGELELCVFVLIFLVMNTVFGTEQTFNK